MSLQCMQFPIALFRLASVAPSVHNELGHLQHDDNTVDVLLADRNACDTLTRQAADLTIVKRHVEQLAYVLKLLHSVQKTCCIRCTFF